MGKGAAFEQPRRIRRSLPIRIFDPTMRKRSHISSNGGPEGGNSEVRYSIRVDDASARTLRDGDGDPVVGRRSSNVGPEGGNPKGFQARQNACDIKPDNVSSYNLILKKEANVISLIVATCIHKR